MSFSWKKEAFSCTTTTQFKINFWHTVHNHKMNCCPVTHCSCISKHQGQWLIASDKCNTVDFISSPDGSKPVTDVTPLNKTGIIEQSNNVFASKQDKNFSNSSFEEYGVTILYMYCTGNSLKNEVCYVGCLMFSQIQYMCQLNRLKPSGFFTYHQI